MQAGTGVPFRPEGRYLMGAFAEWQPQYAAHGIATFPVIIDGKDKRPAVSGYLKLGSKVSSQLTMKFPGHEAIGLACRRNKITVLDVDTPDERVLADGLSRHGHTPFIVRSGSGNFQAWYRHNGEKRRVRPDPGRPIDILGDGYVVAPPSRGSRGRYEIIQGSLDDLDRLPRMIGGQDNAPPPSPVEPGAEGIVNNLAGAGKRNDSLWRHCMRAVRGCARLEDLMEIAVSYNRTQFYEPLPDAEVLRVIASVMSYESQGKNWFGHGARVVVETAVVDDLASSDPHAFALLSILRRHHFGRDFALAKVFAETLGWTLPRFKSARDVLVKRKLIECIHRGGNGPKDPPIYRLAKGYENVPQ
ncbi:bifunctional DNA primase/polymerase [Ensifer sp. 2YAB10]|uniref:bifunctional DNA primase/polymerase n=1 Tax=unclassified Ensifer TaxID=2633371 RepID=UPI003F91905F